MEWSGNKETQAAFVAGFQGRGGAWVAADTGPSVERGSTPGPPCLIPSTLAVSRQPSSQPDYLVWVW